MTNHIQIRPEPIDVSGEDPFKNDLLDRKRFVEALVSVLESTRGPTVFAIDGRWGTGKTTLALMLSSYLQANDFTVVNVNAWDTDYTGDPLVALTSAVVDSMGKDAQMMEVMQRMQVVAPKVIGVIEAIMLSLEMLEKKGRAGQLMQNVAKMRFKLFQEYSHSIEQFREELRELGKKYSKPLVVIVDELDRCRPTYAVEMLETIKHVFNVENILFIFTINRKQLDQSATILYGSFDDPESYFSRFFDIELALPDGSKKEAIRSMLQSLSIDDLSVFEIDMFVEFLGRSPYGMRNIKQTLSHYALIHASLRKKYNKKDNWGFALSVAMLLRRVRMDDYRAFLRREISDAELVDNLFEFNWAIALKGTEEGNLLEGMLMVASENYRNDQQRQISELRQRLEEEEQKRFDQAVGEKSTKSTYGRLAHIPSSISSEEWARRLGQAGKLFWEIVNLIETLGLE